MEKTLVLLKPCTLQRGLVGEVINRFEKRGLRLAGMKMMQLTDAILDEHYAHLREGIEAVNVVRAMAGATNGRNALPGTIRGDYCMSNQQNIVHTSDSLENAKIELARFFKPEEIFEYESSNLGYLYALDEL